jgi:hypothetical protein
MGETLGEGTEQDAEVTWRKWKWKKLDNEEFDIYYSSLYAIRAIKSLDGQYALESCDI